MVEDESSFEKRLLDTQDPKHNGLCLGARRGGSVLSILVR